MVGSLFLSVLILECTNSTQTCAETFFSHCPEIVNKYNNGTTIEEIDEYLIPRSMKNLETITMPDCTGENQIIETNEIKKPRSALQLSSNDLNYLTKECGDSSRAFN